MIYDFRSHYDKKSAAAVGIELEVWAARREAGEKFCRLCQTWRPLGEFWRDRKFRDGRKSQCGICLRQCKDKTRTKWSKKEHQAFLKLLGRHSGPEIAKKLGRSLPAVQHHARSNGWSLRLGEGLVYPYRELERLLGITKDTFQYWLQMGLSLERTGHTPLVAQGELLSFWRLHPEAFDVYSLDEDTCDLLGVDLEDWPEVPAFKAMTCAGFERECEGTNYTVEHPRVWFPLDLFQSKLACPVCGKNLVKSATHYTNDWFEPTFSKRPPKGCFVRVPRKKTWKAWTPQDMVYLQIHFGLLSIAEMSEALARTPSSLHRQSDLQGLQEKTRKDLQDWRIYTPVHLCEVFGLNRKRFDSFIEHGLRYYALPGQMGVSAKHFKKFIRKVRPEALDPETFSTKQKKLLAMNDRADTCPPNFKYIFCDGFESSKFPGVQLKHDPVWVCLDLYKERTCCPVCYRNFPMWADAYTNDYIGDVIPGRALPKKAWKARPPEKCVTEPLSLEPLLKRRRKALGIKP